MLTGFLSSILFTFQANKQLHVKDISPELVQSAKSIREISPTQIECLQAFLDCGELIDWIRKEVPSNV